MRVVEGVLQVRANTGDVEGLVTLVVEAQQDSDRLAQDELCSTQWQSTNNQHNANRMDAK